MTTRPGATVLKDAEPLTTTAATRDASSPPHQHDTGEPRRDRGREQAELPVVRDEEASRPRSTAGDDCYEVAPRRLPRVNGGGDAARLPSTSTKVGGACRPGQRPWARPGPYFGRRRAAHVVPDVALSLMCRPCAGRAGSTHDHCRGTQQALPPHTAVDAVSFRAEPGSVTGFLGPNGAGKSTTMRMMTGLTPLLGSRHHPGCPLRPAPQPGPARRRPAGRLRTAPRAHRARVLRLGAMLMGLSRRRVDEMLEVVGLTDGEGDRRTGNYSLGMRQRLGIAHASSATRRC